MEGKEKEWGKGKKSGEKEFPAVGPPLRRSSFTRSCLAKYNMAVTPVPHCRFPSPFFPIPRSLSLRYPLNPTSLRLRVALLPSFFSDRDRAHTALPPFETRARISRDASPLIPHFPAAPISKSTSCVSREKRLSSFDDTCWQNRLKLSYRKVSTSYIVNSIISKYNICASLHELLNASLLP